MGLLQEAIIGRLGSRFSLDFRPKEKSVYLSPMGSFYDQAVEMGIGLRLGGEIYILPFANIEGTKHFIKVEQEFLMEGLDFKVRDEKLGLEFACRIYAPFYPEDRQISTAPFYYIDLEVRSFLHGRSLFEQVNGEWFFSISGSHIGNNNEILLPFESELVKDCWYNTDECPVEAHSKFSESTFAGEVKIVPLKSDSSWQVSTNSTNVCLSKQFNLESNHQVLQETLIIAGFQPDTVLKAWKKNCRFLYTDYFSNIDEVIKYARTEREKVLRKNDLFVKTIDNSTIGEAAKSLIACGFQNYLVNSWWVLDDNNSDWFFIWEGWCAFHSTLDVEYNNAWFALLYWPELLEKQLNAWYNNLQPEGFPSHDIGILLEVNNQVYPHHMPVEESCNLLLLTFAIWRFRGYQKWQKYLPEVFKVVNYLLTTDTTGNGYPNIGVANTVDDAAATVQYAKEQTYLALKVLSALTAYLELAKALPESKVPKELNEKSMAVMAKIRNTMDTVAWLDDHYAVCLPQSAEGLRDVWTGREIGDTELVGWDAYSLYTSNGLLFLLAAGVKPDLDYERIKTDLTKALYKSLTPYGCTHSSIDRSNVWLSQNLWRDQISGYLGIDLLDMTERYWRFLEWENTQGRGGCYVDTYGWNWLSYYPRGVTAIGLLASMAGLKVKATEKTIEIAPVRCPSRFPLLILADWEKGTVPWMNCRLDNGEPVYRLEGKCPDDWKVNCNFKREKL